MLLRLQRQSLSFRHLNALKTLSEDKLQKQYTFGPKVTLIKEMNIIDQLDQLRQLLIRYERDGWQKLLLR